MNKKYKEGLYLEENWKSLFNANAWNSSRHVISENPYDIIITHIEGLFVT